MIESSACNALSSKIRLIGASFCSLTSTTMARLATTPNGVSALANRWVTRGTGLFDDLILAGSGPGCPKYQP